MCNRKNTELWEEENWEAVQTRQDRREVRVVAEGRGLWKRRSPSMGHFQIKWAYAWACKVEGAPKQRSVQVLWSCGQKYTMASETQSSTARLVTFLYWCLHWLFWREEECAAKGFGSKLHSYPCSLRALRKEERWQLRRAISYISENDECGMMNVRTSTMRHQEKVIKVNIRKEIKECPVCLKNV